MLNLDRTQKYEYILLVVDYVTKWEEAIAVQHVDAKTAIHFLKKNIFSRFGTPRVLISDGGSHFLMPNSQNSSNTTVSNTR